MFISYIFLHIREMDKFPPWNTQSLIPQSCSVLDPDHPFCLKRLRCLLNPTSWWLLGRRKGVLRAATSPLPRRDCACAWSRGLQSFQGWHLLPHTPHSSWPEISPRLFYTGYTVSQLQFEAEKWKTSFHIDSLSRKLRMWEWVTFCRPKSV